MIKRITLGQVLILPILALQLTGCLGKGGGVHLLTSEYLDSPSQIVRRDAAVQQKADALHAFLVGEIALDKGETSQGLAALKRASGLVETPIPEISRQIAELHLARREIDEAIVAYEELHALNSKDSSVLIPLAGLYELKGGYDKALSLYDAVSPREPSELEAQLLRTVVVGRQMGVSARTKALESVAKKYSKEVLPQLLLGLSYEEEGNLKAAEKSILKAVRCDEKKVSTLVELMRIQVQELELEDAVKTAREIVRREPENLLARRVIGSLDSGALQLEAKSFKLPPRHASDAIGTRLMIALNDIDRNKFVSAQEHLSLLVAADPSDTQVRVFLSTVFSALGKRTEAIAELEAIPPNARNYPRSRMLAAYIYKASGNVAAAEKAARQALSVSSDDAAAKGFLIEQLKEQGNFREAITLVRDSLSTRPQDPKLLFLLATLQHDAGEHADALITIEKVLALDPNNENSLNYAAYAMAEGGRDLPKARSYIEKALLQDPTNGYFLDTLGWIQYQEEKYEEAATAFTAALKTIPMDAVIILHAARTYEKLERYEQVVALLEKNVEQLDEVVLRDEEQQEALRELKAMLRALKRSHPSLFTPHYTLPQ
jgi:tetratricopeptide (TPR) repeat protein